MEKKLNKLLTRIKKIADMDCTCTEEQHLGIDSSMCSPCTAGNYYNEISNLIQLANEHLIDFKGKD